MRARWARLRARGTQTGATETLEAVIWIPVLVLVILIGVGASLYSRASAVVDTAAGAAARAASLASSAEGAQAKGQAAAEQALAGKCTQLVVTVDASQMVSPQLGSAVRATVQCTMSSSLVVPGFPGTFTTTRSETAPVDLLREGRQG